MVSGDGGRRASIPWLFNGVKNKDVEDIVILAGDHLYRMDYMKFVEYHRETNADITVGTLPIEEERASDSD